MSQSSSYTPAVEDEGFLPVPYPYMNNPNALILDEVKPLEQLGIAGTLLGEIVSNCPQDKPFQTYLDELLDGRSDSLNRLTDMQAAVGLDPIRQASTIGLINHPRSQGYRVLFTRRQDPGDVHPSDMLVFVDTVSGSIMKVDNTTSPHTLLSYDPVKRTIATSMMKRSNLFARNDAEKLLGVDGVTAAVDAINKNLQQESRTRHRNPEGKSDPRIVRSEHLQNIGYGRQAERIRQSTAVVHNVYAELSRVTARFPTLTDKLATCSRTLLKEIQEETIIMDFPMVLQRMIEASGNALAKDTITLTSSDGKHATTLSFLRTQIPLQDNLRVQENPLLLTWWEDGGQNANHTQWHETFAESRSAQAGQYSLDLVRFLQEKDIISPHDDPNTFATRQQVLRMLASSLANQNLLYAHDRNQQLSPILERFFSLQEKDYSGTPKFQTIYDMIGKKYVPPYRP